MNVVVIDGYIQDEPRINTNQETGNTVVGLTIGNQRYIGKDQQGLPQRETSYFYCKTFGYMTKWVMKVRKDQKIYIKGQLVQEKWLDKEGRKHSAVVIYIEDMGYCETGRQQ